MKNKEPFFLNARQKVLAHNSVIVVHYLVDGLPGKASIIKVTHRQLQQTNDDSYHTMYCIIGIMLC